MAFCVLIQNEIVSLDPFTPKGVTSQDHEAGLCTLSQYPTQAAKMVASQFTYQSKGLRNLRTQASTSDSGGEYEKLKNDCSKRARILEDDSETGPQISGLNHGGSLSRMTSGGDETTEMTLGASDAVPDVAAAIEDLLEQTSKVSLIHFIPLCCFLYYLISLLVRLYDLHPKACP